MENPDSCSYLLKDAQFKDVCDALGMDNQIWTEFAKSADVLKCPLEPVSGLITRKFYL